MKLLEPTPEYVKKMGDRYVPALTDRTVRRPYGSRKRALETIRDKSSRMTEDQFSALSQLRTYLDGAKRYIGLVSSYGDQRGNGTPISQQERLANRLNGEIQEEWPIYCADKVRQAEFTVNHPLSWGVIVMVLHEDNNLVDAGLMLGAKGEKYAQEKASKLFWMAAPKIHRLYYPGNYILDIGSEHSEVGSDRPARAPKEVRHG